MKYDYPSRPELDILLINGSYDREHERMLEVNYEVPVLAGSRDPSRPISATPATAANATAAANPTTAGRPPSAKPATPANTAAPQRPPSAKDRYEHEKVHHILPKTHKLDEGAVLLLYDAAKETYVLCDDTIIQLMKLHTMFIPQYRKLRQDMFGEHDILMPKIDENEEFVEEKKKHDRHVEVVIVRSYAVLGKDMVNTFDTKREKVWRRFLRQHVSKWFADVKKLEALREMIRLDIEIEEKRRQDALLPIMETDQNSTDSSTVKKKKKKKGNKKTGKEKDGKKKTGKETKKKGKDIEDEEDGDDDDEEGEVGILPSALQKPSSPANPGARSTTPTSPSTRKKK